MRTKIVRAIVAALIAGTLLIAGAAPYGEPGTLQNVAPIGGGGGN